MENPWHKTMISCKEHLVDGIAANGPNSIGDALVGDDLITGDVYSGLLLPAIDAAKARDIVNSATGIVKSDGEEKFNKFLPILSRFGLKKQVVELKNTLAKKKAEIAKEKAEIATPTPQEQPNYGVNIPIAPRIQEQPTPPVQIRTGPRTVSNGEKAVPMVPAGQRVVGDGEMAVPKFSADQHVEIDGEKDISMFSSLQLSSDHKFDDHHPIINADTYRQRFTSTLLNLQSLHGIGLDGSNTKIAIIDRIDYYYADRFQWSHKAFSTYNQEGKVVICNIDHEFISYGKGKQELSDHAMICAGIAVGMPFSGQMNINGQMTPINYPGGVAPKAKATLFLIDLDDNATFYEALDRISKRDYDVLSLSLGSIPEDETTSEKLAALKDIIIVAAAGNKGNAVTVVHPAVLPEVISVGSLDVNCKLSGFSPDTPDVNMFCYGEVVAPCRDENGVQLLNWSTGTSMATPAIAGLVCLIIQCAKKQNYYPNIKKNWKILRLLRKMIKKSDGSFKTDGVHDILVAALKDGYFKSVF